jgi:hypothetical protein
MDEIRFEVGTREDVSAGLTDAVLVFVNGRDLREIAREVELPYASQEGRPEMSGSYVGLAPGEVFLPSCRLFGEPETYYDGDTPGKIAVLGCECGVVDC